METPSSTRRVTRSQTLSAMKSSQRNALFDITNDSPIVGVAMQTPSSGMVGKRNVSRIKSTPGSGEALLRGQVKTLLQKVEEEADLTKISIEPRPFIHLVSSPMALLAPTPANTPQVLDFSGDYDRVKIVITSPVVEGQLRTASQVEESNIFEEKEESLVLEKCPSITRSLLLDFSDKLEIWESSVVTRNTEDDTSSVWSMQVNASTKDEEEEEDDEDGEVYSYTEEEDERIVDGLCEGMRKMSFAGKHTRFLYDSEDEEIVETKEQSPQVLRLKGFFTPIGKHVRFEGDE